MKDLAIYVSALALFVAIPSCKRSAAERSRTLEEVEVAAPVIDSALIYKTYPGYIVADKEVELVARVDGQLLSKEYASGDFVKAGTILFRIEDRNYRDAVERARAALATAKSNREYASARYAAMVEALKGDAVSEMEVAQAKNALEESEAAVKNGMAALQTAETQLSYCTVRAPFDGHVTSAAYDVGSYLAGEAAPVKLATIYDDKQMIAKFSVEDDETLGRLRANISEGIIDYGAIPLTFTEAMAHKYTASLYYLAPRVDTSTGTMQLQAMIDNPYNELRSGMFVTVSLPLVYEPHAMLVSEAAISTDQLGKYVYVVNDSDKVVYTPIQTGGQVRDSLQIVTKGLSTDDRYVTKALLKVRDGMIVKPIKTN